MFRVTPRGQTQTAIFHSQSMALRLASLQNQASSGLKYSRPSDNPLDTHKIGVGKRALAYLETQKQSINDAQTILNSGVSQLLEANNLMTRAKQIALQAPQTLGQDEHVVLAKEVDSLIDRFLAISNHQEEGQYLFSGNALDVPPYQMTDSAGQAIAHVSYHGSTNPATAVISNAIAIQTNYSGQQIFQPPGGQRQTALYLGDTGAAAGTGTDSHRGRVDLQVDHSLTTFQAGSGVAAGVSSVQGDTILGPNGIHSLTLNDTSGDGSSGTVSLNGGSPVAWDSTETDLQVVGPRGEIVHLNTTAISAGFNGDVSIQADGTLSTDGGITKVAIDFSSNQNLIDNVTGGVTNVDSSEIRSSGIEPIEFPETSDALTALLELREDLRNPHGFSSGDRNAAFERRVGDFERISRHVLDHVGAMSVSLLDLEQLSFQNDQKQLDTTARIGELEAADLAEVVIEMQSLQSALQFNYASLSIVQSNNLLDFLG